MTQYEVVPVAAPGWSYLHKLVRGVGRQHYSPVITTLPTAGEIIGPGGQITQPGRDFGQIGAARRWNATPDNASPISYTIFHPNYEIWLFLLISRDFITSPTVQFNIRLSLRAPVFNVSLSSHFKKNWKTIWQPWLLSKVLSTWLLRNQAIEQLSPYPRNVVFAISYHSISRKFAQKFATSPSLFNF